MTTSFDCVVLTPPHNTMRSFELVFSVTACALSATAQSIGSAGDTQYGPNSAAGYAITHFGGAAQLAAVSSLFCWARAGVVFVCRLSHACVLSEQSELGTQQGKGYSRNVYELS